MRFTRKAKIAVVSGISAVALTAGAGTAFAGTAHHAVTPRTTTANWQFDLQQSQIGPRVVNDVEGRGVLPMAGWTDTGLSPTVDRFSRGGNSVTIRHSPLPFPTVELDTCTINFDQNEGRFVILSGTGTGAGLRSVNGVFNLRGMISVRNAFIRVGNGVRSFCPLSRVPVATLYDDVVNGRSLPGVVDFQDFAVQGDAQVVRSVPFPPFAPVTPGQPIITPTPGPTHTHLPVTPTVAPVSS